MNKQELLTLLSAFPNNAELLVDIGDRYAEIKDIKLEYSQRTDGRKPFIKIGAYLDGYKKEREVLDKIRTEIIDHAHNAWEENKGNNLHMTFNYVNGIYKALAIIDKYREET